MATVFRFSSKGLFCKLLLGFVIVRFFWKFSLKNHAASTNSSNDEMTSEIEIFLDQLIQKYNNFNFLYLACNLCLKIPNQPSHQLSTPTTRPLEGAIITVPTTSESPIIWSTYLFRNKTCKGKSMLKNRNTIPKSLSWGKKRRWNLGKPVFLSVKRDNLRYVLDNLSFLLM